MRVNDRKIGSDVEPFIIAELSANHGGSLEKAKQSIIAAASTGVSAVKIQTYTPDTMTIKSDRDDFAISNGIWSGKTLYELYSEAYTPFEWHQELFDLAKQLNITLFSTPFDETAVDLLEELNTPAYKIASFELTDTHLLKYVASKQKPIFMSTGMASIQEISDAVEALRSETDADILLFHCISSYPSPVEQSHLNNIAWLKRNFEIEVGLSDHTTNNIAAITAIGIGAVAIEKHFKLDELAGGPDASFSLTVEELAKLVLECKQAWNAIGEADFSRAQVEKENLIFRRSLYFVNNLSSGQIVKASDVRRIRPGFGLHPKFLVSVIGKQVRRDVVRGEPVVWDALMD